MATLELLGFEDLDDAFRRIAEIPATVTSQALDAMAGVAAEKIRQSGMTMGVYDPESDVHILDKIKPTKAKITERGGTEDITFSGSRRRGDTTTRNAEIAFVNEYGKRGQPARPFIGRAMTQHEDQISAAGEEIVGSWIETNFGK